MFLSMSFMKVNHLKKKKEKRKKKKENHEGKL